MKHGIALTINVLLLSVLLLTGIAQSQYVSRIIKVRVPFAFEVGARTLPAGEYSLVKTGSHQLSLRNSRGQILANLLTGAVERSDAGGPAKLDFYVDGDRHVLARVWQEHEPLGYQISTPKRSTYLAKRRNSGIQATVEGSQP
jgi:hypothetical protein